MKMSRSHGPLLAALAAVAFAAPVRALEPNAVETDAAVQSGDFADCLARTTAWLNEKTLAAADETSLVALLTDPAFLAVLDQRQLIAKTGADKLAAFAKTDAAHREFLAWLLKNTPAMELYLEGAVPIGLAAREDNNYRLDTAALEIWRQILQADPDSKDGLYLKLAIATALAPPGSVNIGAGGAGTPENPVARYRHYKAAHQNKELFPSFDRLTVWEYSRIVCSGASNADLTWARQMINTFRPDFRADEMVVNSTSLVWRRNSPIPYAGSFKNVLAGGGKCGPRSSWSVMVCHAFGIPAIGVGQPAHACVAYKAANPMTEPQPGNAWKVAFGRGWQVSRLMGLTGPEFLAGVEERADAAQFSRAEHLRWLAAALASADRAAVVMKVAHKIQKSVAKGKTDLTASHKPEEADAEPGGKPAAKQARAASFPSAGTGAGPIKAEADVIHVDAASFARTGGQNSWAGQLPHVLVHDCLTGGKQVYFQQQMKAQWAEYAIDVPAAGTYQVVMKAACINTDQALEICSRGNVIATVPIPLSYGLWRQTAPVKLKLEQGVQTLRVQTSTTELKRGIALRWFELKQLGSTRHRVVAYGTTVSPHYCREPRAADL